jgi:DNA damage-binding protein 1
VQIHDEPIPVDEEDVDDGDAALELGDTTYLSVVEEYTHLGPIVDFDLVPMAGTAYSSPSTYNFGQSQVVTASGSSKSRSLRVIRNVIGMKEYASVELSGIPSMWSLRANYEDTRDAYLVQSFISETRVLGVISLEQPHESAAMEVEEGKDGYVNMEDDLEIGSKVGGILEEVFLSGLHSSTSTLYIGNVVGNFLLQITDVDVRLPTMEGSIMDTFVPGTSITVASGNEAGQVLIAIRGGEVIFMEVQDSMHVRRSYKQIDREVTSLDINPFKPIGKEETLDVSSGSEKVDGASRRKLNRATLCAIGLRDDFTVRLLSLESSELYKVLQIHLSTEDEELEVTDGNSQGQLRNRNIMMAGSLCLITLHTGLFLICWIYCVIIIELWQRGISNQQNKYNKEIYFRQTQHSVHASN